MKPGSTIFPFIALFFSVNIYAQSADMNAGTVQSFSGKVTDSKTGEPLAGASIYFADLKTGAVSNNEGIFAFSSIAQGKHLVEVSHLGYTSIIETIDLTTTKQKDFALEPSVIENEGVTITGVSTATSVKTTPVPVNIIRREDLLRNSSTNLIDNISRTPGVSQVSTGPAVSKPFIRGLGYNRVVVVHDGVRHEGQQWGDEHGVEIDELSVNRVEVLKGPASLMYGSDALAGVVNILSVQPAPEGVIRGNILAGYQTNNRQRNLHLDLDGNHNGFIWGIYGSHKAAADYKNKRDGYVLNSKFNEKNFGGYIGLNKNWGYSHLLVSNFNQHFGLIEGERDAVTGQFIKLINNNGAEEEAIATDEDFKSTDPLIPRQHLLHLKIALDNSFRIGQNRLTATVAYQHDQRQEFGNVLDEKERELFFDLNVINYNLQYHFAEKNNWRTSIGVNGMNQVHKNKGEEALIPDYSLFDIGAFIYTRKKIDRLTLSGGIRFDNRSIDSELMEEGGDIKFADFKKSFSNFSGSAGLAWEASKMVILKFNVARGFRAPTLPELSSNGAHEGTNRYEYGKLDLKSETSLQTDAGIELNSEHVSLNASIFLNTLNNFIYYSKLAAVGGGDSIITDGSDEFFAFQFTQDNAKLYGAEFNLDFHPHPLDWLHVENTFSWVRGQLNKEVDGSKDLPLIPAARLINEVKVDLFKKGKIIRNVFISGELDNSFNQDQPFTGFNTETATKGYSLLNAGIGGDIRSSKRTLCTFFIGANNITDVAYQNHLSRLKYAPENPVTGRMGVFNTGRNFSFKINIPLEF
jgi:iron complex outermembrane recepter protein